MSKVWHFTIRDERDAEYRVRESWLQEALKPYVLDFETICLVDLKKRLPSDWCSVNISSNDVIIYSGRSIAPYEFLKRSMGKKWDTVVRVWNLCDNYLSFPGARSEVQLRNILYKMRISDHVVVSSKYLQQDVQRFRNDPVYLVQDPVFDRRHKDAKPIRESDELRILWHGHEQGAYATHWNRTIFDQIQLHKDKLPSKIKIKFVTSEFQSAAVRGTLLDEKWMTGGEGLNLGDNVEVIYEKWENEKQAEENYKWTDFVIIPISKSVIIKKMTRDIASLGMDKFIASKSPNRVTDAIAAGVPVIASNLVDSYWEFRNYTPIVTKENGYIPALINCLNNKESTIAKLKTGQKYIKDNYSVRATANQWKIILKKIGEQHEGTTIRISP